MRGSLILVVGPSCAGKDSLIHRARAHFASDAALVFARRCITRPAEPDGEAHESVSRVEFDRRQRSGAFMLAWQAHGLWYGIPRPYDADLASGRSVVVNVSRTVVGDARQRFQPCSILHVSASSQNIARRLASRGREAAEDRAARLWRTVDAVLTGPDVVIIRNDESLDDAASTFIACLEAIIWGAHEACSAK